METSHAVTEDSLADWKASIYARARVLRGACTLQCKTKVWFTKTDFTCKQKNHTRSRSATGCLQLMSVLTSQKTNINCKQSVAECDLWCDFSACKAVIRTILWLC